MNARLDQRQVKADIAAGATPEKQVDQRPQDGDAYERTALDYQRTGRWREAAQARAEALRLLGETPERLTRYGEALAYASDGVATPDAVEQLERALAPR